MGIFHQMTGRGPWVALFTRRKSQYYREEVLFSMIVYRCDLCNEIRDCTQKEIDGKEYDICSECWNSLSAKLSGKGRSKRCEFVTLPAPTMPESPREPKQPPMPGAPPVIYGSADPMN